MPIANFPQATKKFELTTYKRPKDFANLRKTHVPYSGAPQKHPIDKDKVILVPDPFGTMSSYYEFQTSDISFVEELQNIVDIEGETVPMARIWVKKGSVGKHCTLFQVEETRL